MGQGRQNDTADNSQDLWLDRAQLDSGLNFLFLAAFPLLLWIFDSTFAGLATAVASMWVLSLALRLISVGQQLHHDYDRAEVARAPRVPRKVIGSVLIGFVVLVLAGHKFADLLLPALSGGLACLLSIKAFGLDPLRHKGLDRVREMTFLESAEIRLAELADRVALQDDAALTLRVEAARRLVLRPLRENAGSPEMIARLERPIEKVIRLLGDELSRFESQHEGHGRILARRRFIAKLDVITESFDSFASRQGLRGPRDAFERQADMLIDRMPRESAA